MFPDVSPGSWLMTSAKIISLVLCIIISQTGIEVLQDYEAAVGLLAKNFEAILLGITTNSGGPTGCIAA